MEYYKVDLYDGKVNSIDENYFIDFISNSLKYEYVKKFNKKENILSYKFEEEILMCIG